jgi:hypothetical protein
MRHDIKTANAVFEVKSTTISAADAAAWGFRTMASIDNPKASKATAYGYLNGILYMAPADSAGVGNLCVNAGACKALCLGLHSGQAAIGAAAKNHTIKARKARAVAYMKARRAFLAYVDKDVARLAAIAEKLSLTLCYRFNGSTDVGIPVDILRKYPNVVFIDYTKMENKMLAYLAGKFPANYHVTFSRDTHNEAFAERVLAMGGNVAVVGDIDSIGNDALRNAPRVDGDKHDIRIPALDGSGKVIVLSPKGHKAKRDMSGFVVRAAA